MTEARPLPSCNRQCVAFCHENGFSSSLSLRRTCWGMRSLRKHACDGGASEKPSPMRDLSAICCGSSMRKWRKKLKERRRLHSWAALQKELAARARSSSQATQGKEWNLSAKARYALASVVLLVASSVPHRPHSARVCVGTGAPGFGEPV